MTAEKESAKTNNNSADEKISKELLAKKTPDELRAEIAAIEKKRQEDLKQVKEEAKRTRKLYATVLYKKEHEQKTSDRKLDNRAKIMAGVGVIGFMKEHPDQLPAFSTFLKTFYANKPDFLVLAQRGLNLTVKAPAAETKTV